MIEYLSSPRSSIKQFSAKVLHSICINNLKNIQFVISENALFSLIPLLSSPDASILFYTLHAIYSIIEEDRSSLPFIFTPFHFLPSAFPSALPSLFSPLLLMLPFCALSALPSLLPFPFVICFSLICSSFAFLLFVSLHFGRNTSFFVKAHLVGSR